MTNPTSTKFPDSATEMAERIQAMSLADDYTWEDRAYEMLRIVLRAGWPDKDGGLTGLLERAHAKGGDEAVEEWLYRLERASTTDTTVRNNQFQSAKLLAIPLAVIPGGTPVESALEQSRATVETAIEQVVGNLKKSGMVRDEAGLYALPRLYTAAEVSRLSYADVARLLDIGIEGVTCTHDRQGRGLGALPVHERDEADPGSVEPLLANPVFLVLVHIDDKQYTLFSPRNNAGLPLNDLQTRYWNWAFESAELLEEAIGSDVFVEMSAVPLEFYDGYRVGVEGARGILLTAEVATLCMDAVGQGVTRDGIVAQFLYVTEEEARLRFRHLVTGEMLGTAILPVFEWETPEVAKDSIETLLYDLGLAWPGVFPTDVSGPIDSVQGG